MLNGLKTSLFYILCGSCRFRLAMSPTTPLEVIFLAMKDILWFEWLYAVTPDGRIWSYPKNWRNKNGRFLSLSHSLGYTTAILYNGDKTEAIRVHRMVALTYIPNPDNKPFINHKNGIRDDNRIENLEWCTQSENMTHAYRTLWIKHPQNKPVIQMGKDWTVLWEFESSSHAWKALNIDWGNIRYCVRWERKSAWWYKWKYLVPSESI